MDRIYPKGKVNSLYLHPTEEWKCHGMYQLDKEIVMHILSMQDNRNHQHKARDFQNLMDTRLAQDKVNNPLPFPDSLNQDLHNIQEDMATDLALLYLWDSNALPHKQPQLLHPLDIDH